jgi:hypothetical protein
MTTDALALPADQVDGPRASGTEWRTAARIGFRFVFCYWLLYCMPEWGRVSLVDFIPSVDHIERPYVWLWHKITPWVAQHLFHLSGARITYFMTGSGDTTLDYVQNLLFVLIAALATLVWSLLDRKRKDYGTLHAWLRILVRFTLALTLFSYGISKIIPTQFQPPNLVQLTEAYGEASPMGLLWTFMGASMAYTIFSGLAEATAAMLLLFRRTALLGALVAAGVLLNIAMLNFCYDVPVKLYSVNLLLMSLFLLLPDVSRLVNMFLLNRVAPPGELTKPHFPQRWMRISAKALTLALFAYFVATSAWGGWQQHQHSGFNGEPPVYGVYAVDSLNLNGMPALSADTANPGWKQVIAEHGFWMMKHADGTRDYFAPHFDAKRSMVDLYSWKTRLDIKLNYAQPDALLLVLTGHLGDDSLEVRLHRTNEEQFLLTHRGFHWISEYPFNR